MRMAPNPTDSRGLRLAGLLRRLRCGEFGTWGTLAFSVALGLLIGGAAWAGGQPGLGLFAVALMTALGLVFVVGRRSESLRMMAGERSDERWRLINLRATAFAGNVLVLAVIGAFVWEIAHGRSGQPFTLLGALAGVSYLLAVTWLRWRS